MKLVTICAAILAMAATSVAQTILVDHGTAAATPTLGGTWNSVNFAQSGASLVDTSGAPTGVTITYAGDWLDTSVDQGPWPAGDTSWVDADATADYVFTVDGGTVTFSGLIPGAPYNFQHVAARSLGADRIADYMVNGMFADSTPNGDDFASLGDGWNGGNILVWNSVAADPAGQITLSVTDVQSFGYVNASRLSLIPEPATASLVGISLLALGGLRRRR